MARQIVILGGGTGGTIAAKRLRRRQLRPGVTFHEVAVEAVDRERDTVQLAGGGELPYDVLVVASGCSLLPEETEGLTGPGWNERVFTFYDVPGTSCRRSRRSSPWASSTVSRPAGRSSSHREQTVDNMAAMTEAHLIGSCSGTAAPQAAVCAIEIIAVIPR